jgi:tetratricopeptide (TPR) repeat protein
MHMRRSIAPGLPAALVRTWETLTDTSSCIIMVLNQASWVAAPLTGKTCFQQMAYVRLGGLVKRHVKWMIAGGVIVALGVAGYLTYPSWAYLVSSAGAWARYFAQTQNVSQLLMALVIAVVALTELVVAFVLRQRGQGFRLEAEALSEHHRQEIDLLHREVHLLQEEKAEIAAELQVRDEMVRQERSILLARLRRLQSDAGIPLQATVTHLIPRLSSRDISGIEQALSRLEQIELTMDVAHRPSEDEEDEQSAARARDWIRLGNAYYYIGLHPKAVTYYERAQVLRPREVTAYVNRGFALLIQGNVHEAIESFDWATRVDGSSPHAYAGRGLAYEALGSERRALEEYNRAVRLAPDWVEAYYVRGAVLAKLHQYDRAAQDLERATALDDTFALAHMARGIARAATREYLWALRDLSAAIDRDPAMAEAYYHRGVVRAALGEHAMAIDDFTRSLDLSPADCQVLRARASALMDLDRYSNALQDCSHVIELDGGDARTFNQRGRAYLELKEYRVALADLNRAIELSPGFTQAYINRGQVYERMGQYQEALADLNRAIELEPELAQAYYHRGVLYGSIGAYEKATESLNKAIELDPSLAE